jgi:repressor LexA
MSNAPLTKKQREILDYILKITREHNYTPSYREIADALGLSSPATVHEHVSRLREKGYLMDEEGAPAVVKNEIFPNKFVGQSHFFYVVCILYNASF